jgi:hypothetical protein
LAFQHIEFKRGSSSPDHTVILVNTKKFIDLYENNHDSLSPIEKATRWDSAKLKGLEAFLKPGSGQPEMPRISFELRKTAGTWRNLWHTEFLPVLTFANGRHRVRYLEYAGAFCFPVEVRTEGVSDLAKRCGP